MESNGPERIKVALVINDFLVGGAQKLLVDLMSRLDRERFSPVLITLFRFGDGEEKYLYRSLPEGTEVYALSFRSFWDMGAWASLIRAMRSVDADVVLANLFLTNTVMRMLAPFFRYRTITVEHNTYTKKARLHQLIDRILSPLSSRIVAVSNTVADFTATQEHIPRGKFTVINSAIDAASLRKEAEESDPAATRAAYDLSDGEKLIINVSRVVPQKNHKLLVDGFKRFSAKHPEYRVFVVGTGNKLEEMRAYAESEGISDKLRFLGFVERIGPLFRIAQFFVSTSLIEGFGIAHGEALACGLPVLSTKTAGPDEMIREGVNGYFIESDMPEAVEAGMERMIAADLSTMRAPARETAERYSIARAVDSYEKLFESVVRPRIKL